MSIMHKIKQEIAFEAGHRLMNYDGKCKYLHGHNYKVTLHLAASYLNDTGFVQDFSDVKKIAQKFIDGALDHGFMLNANDTYWVNILLKQNQKVYLFPQNPTAEVIAEEIYEKLKPSIFHLVAVSVQETPKSEATYYGDWEHKEV